MKIRRDAIFTLSVPFIIALAVLIPHNLGYVSTWHQRFLPEGRSWLRNYLMPLGFASLTTIFIGLTVIWTGYIKAIRWTWFVMFAIVWLFAFPVYMLPTLLDISATQSI